MRVVNEPLEGGGWMATHEDVTERQRLLEAHEQSEKIVHEQKRQLDVALNNMTHGLCMFDTEGRIVLFNQRYSQLMGQNSCALAWSSKPSSSIGTRNVRSAGCAAPQ